MENSLVSANYFNISFTPDNRTLTYDISINSDVRGYFLAEVDFYAYGIKVVSETIDPCQVDIGNFCPLAPGPVDIRSSSQIEEKVIHEIPKLAYTIPNIDLTVMVKLKTDNSSLLACIQADLTNQRSVDNTAIKWISALIAGFGLATSAVVGIMGSSISASQVSASSLSLLTYFQSMVIISMCAVDRAPPIVSAWIQNFAWSMGIIKVGFMQKWFRWYIQATGGTPDTHLLYPSISVLVQKRDGLYRVARDQSNALLRAPYETFMQRHTGLAATPQNSDTLLVLRGIKRVAYQAKIESTSIVLTVFSFFIIICLGVALWFGSSYCFIKLVREARLFTSHRFLFYSSEELSYFGANSRVMLKGSILRILFIAFPSLLIFSLWEFIQRDSAPVILISVFFIFLSFAILGWSSGKVYAIGEKSARMYGTPAFLLFSDGTVLSQYGVLFAPFKATSYRFLFGLFAYHLLKACFIAFGQGSGKAQVVALFLFEVTHLSSLCYFQPYMDKIPNIVNIATSSITLLNSGFFLFFSEIFRQPRLVSSIMGIIFFVVNAVFALFFLVFVLGTSILALISKHPDSRYRPAQDDRASFIPDLSAVSSGNYELKALGNAVISSGVQLAPQCSVATEEIKDSKVSVISIPTVSGAELKPNYNESSNSRKNEVRISSISETNVCSLSEPYEPSEHASSEPSEAAAPTEASASLEITYGPCEPIHSNSSSESNESCGSSKLSGSSESSNSRESGDSREPIELIEQPREIEACGPSESIESLNQSFKSVELNEQDELTDQSDSESVIDDPMSNKSAVDHEDNSSFNDVVELDSRVVVSRASSSSFISAISDEEAQQTMTAKQ